MRSIVIGLAILVAGPASAQVGEQTGAAVEASPRVVATALADRMASDFVFPETGTKYAAMLRANAAAGVYDRLAGSALAAKLTDDLHAIYPDRHVRVMFEGPDVASPAREPGGGPQRMMRRPPNLPAIEAQRWIAPGIAFVRYNLFPGDDGVVAETMKFLDEHGDAKAIIFDIRTHRGGGLAEMDAIFPRLFAKRTRLVSMATRKSVDERGGTPIRDIDTLSTVKGDPAFVTREHWVTPAMDGRLNDAKVYVLTSTVTGSAAEHFALAMKHTGRGTLIGTHTGGANHFGGMQSLGGGFSAFIPVGRTFDPKTGKDWEGTGILPDIATAPEDALVKALMLAGIAEAEAKRLSAEVAPTAPLVRMPRPAIR